MGVIISSTSRLQHAQLVVLDGIEFWDLPDYPEIPVRTDDLSHDVDDLDRIDLIANTFYKDPTLWWVIALANDIRLPDIQLNPGTTIRIPSPQFVFTEIVRRKR